MYSELHMLSIHQLLYVTGEELLFGDCMVVSQDMQLVI
jgi:hypothetical protein